VHKVGWTVVGLLTSVTGVLILPGRNPAGIGVEAILWAALGAFAVLAIYRFTAGLRTR
jgi:uncharacterized membrane protein YeaQ/YmgE (transglycosylase-associated protein family)